MRIVIVSVFTRPIRSATKPKITPPSAPPMRKLLSATSLKNAISPAVVSGGRSEGIASFMLETKICPSKTSKIQPSDAMSSTSHAYELMPEYQGTFASAESLRSGIFILMRYFRGPVVSGVMGFGIERPCTSASLQVFSRGKT